MGDVATILIVAVVASAITLWLIARATGLPLRDLAAGVLTLGRRERPLTSAAVNPVYRALMREAGIRGPSGIMRVPQLTVVLTPPADYAYIKAFGEREFERQLIEQLNALADKFSWDHDPDGQQSVIFVRDPQRATLHPKIASSGPSDGPTALLRSGTSATPPTQLHAAPEIEPTHSSGSDMMQATGAMSRLVVGQSTVVLDPSRPTSTVGSDPSCTVHIPHDHFSRVQFKLEARGADWVISPATSERRTAPKNPTYLNGAQLLHEVRLADGDRITVGNAEAIVFRR